MHDPANWVVLILVGGVLYFYGWVIMKSRQQQDAQDSTPQAKHQDAARKAQGP